MIYKLNLETEQDKLRSDQFFESIKHIEQETNKFRNTYIKECNEKDELKNGYSKLDEMYKKQASEISMLKHESQEKELELKALSEKEEQQMKERSELSKIEIINEDVIRSLKTEIEELREKNAN